MKTEKFSKNRVICFEGTVESCMYDIISGSVSIVANYGTENEKRLAVLEAGTSFGEIGMIENLPRSATAVAAEDTEVNIIDAADFNAYFKDKPGKVISLIRNTSARIRTLTAQYFEASNCIVQYNRCEESGEKVSDELMDKLQKLSLEGRRK